MKAKTWQDCTGQWYWHILDEYGDEIVCADNGFDTREECRKELREVLKDYE